MPDLPTSQIEHDIHRLDVSLRQLKVQYDMFFAGALPREPFELRAAVDRIIKQYTNASIRKYAHRFHLNTLVSRYNALSELWGKTLREREEGPRGPAATRQDAGKGRKQAVSSCRVHDPLKEQELLKQLHARFLEERRRATGRAGKLSFDSFVRQIAARAEKIRQRAGCEQVELRIIVEDDKVQLKARPGK